MKTWLYGVKKKILISTIIIMLICNAVIAILLGSNYQKNLIGDLKESNLNILKAVALNIDGEAYKELIEKQDMTLPIYNEIQQMLKAVKDAGFTYLYTQYYGDNGKEAYYGVDCEEMSSESFMPLGSVLNYEAIEEEYRALKQEGYHVADFYDDGQWGEVMSLVVAIEDEKGELVGSLACDFSIEEIKSRTKAFRLYLYLLVAIMIIVQSTFLILGMEKQIIKPIKRLREIIIATSEYDFRDITLGKEFYNNNDEMGDIAICIDKMREELRKKAELITEVVNEVTQVAENIYQEMNTSQVAMEQINVSINSLVASVDHERKEAINGTEKLMQLTEKLDVLEQGIEQVEGLMQETQDLTTDVTNTMETLVKFVDEQDSLGRHVLDHMNTLNEEAEQITHVVGNISAITRRTNLVAVNASIEAASAGEVGKGFSVVAGEIKALSDDTFKFTEQIQKKVEEIDICTQNVNSGFYQLREKSVDVSKSSKDIDKEFKQMQEAMNAICKALIDMEQFSKEIKTYKEETVSAIKQIQESSIGNSVIAENLSANTEEQFAITENMLSTTEQLVRTGESLRDSVAEYKL